MHYALCIMNSKNSHFPHFSHCKVKTFFLFLEISKWLCFNKLKENLTKKNNQKTTIISPHFPLISPSKKEKNQSPKKNNQMRNEE